MKLKTTNIVLTSTHNDLTIQKRKHKQILTSYSQPEFVLHSRDGSIAF